MINQITDKTFFAWIAPDGEVQFALMGETEIECLAIAKTLHKSGISKSPHEMMLKGFKILPVRLTVADPGKQVGSEKLEPNQFYFTAITQLVLQHAGERSLHVSSNVSLNFSDRLNPADYYSEDGNLNADGIDALTKTLVCGLSANIHIGHQTGKKDSAEHLREIIAELERQFVRSDATVYTGNFSE